MHRVLLVCTLVLPCWLNLGCGRRPPGPPVPKSSEISASPRHAESELPDATFAPGDWPMWRGAHADGIATGPEIPTTWTATENVTWKSRLPGRGHSSPIVVGDRIFLETADEQAQTQTVLCLKRDNGELVWQKEVHHGNFETQMHQENSQATSTLACDGERLFALFLNDRKIWATAFDLDGNQLWQTEVGSFASKFGYSASPTIYKSLVLLAADHQQGGFLAAIHRQSGDIVWRKSRPEKSSYASARVVTLGGQDQLVVGGCNLVSSYAPETGELLWSVEGTAESAVGTPVISNDLVFDSGGYPEQDTVALKPDGTVAWRQDVKAYCTSLLVHGGHVYLVSDDGIARCFEAASGAEKWKQRIGGNFRVSPILSGDRIFITNMSGKTTVFRADPAKYTRVTENQLGDEGFASPAVSRGQLFLRVADSSQGARQEWLYCIGPAA